jgi:hypothetical protein
MQSPYSDSRGLLTWLRMQYTIYIYMYAPRNHSQGQLLCFAIGCLYVLKLLSVFSPESIYSLTVESLHSAAEELGTRIR